MYKLKQYENELIETFNSISKLKVIIDYYVNVYASVKPHGNIVACGWHLLFDTIEGIDFYNTYLKSVNDDLITTLLIKALYKTGYPENENKVKHNETNLLV